MRSILGALLIALCVSSGAFAFDGPEHQCISERALQIAMRGETLGHCDFQPAESDPCDPKFKGGAKFGHLTRLVDAYQDPLRFDPGDWEGIEKRLKRRLKHLWATHNNTKHFQQDAVDAYATAHKRALEAKNLCDALWYEAIALHYLQDFFSPGHVVTPRVGSTDVVSGSLHDRYNKRGADIIVAKAMFPALDEKSIPKRLYGDGRLDADAINFLVAISALSIREVVQKKRGSEPDTRLTLCFRTRSGLTQPGRDSSASALAGSVTGPFASLQWRPVEAYPDCDCSAEAIVRYDFSHEKDLNDDWYPLWGFQASQWFSVRGGARRVNDFGLLLFANDPNGMRIRDGCNECSNKTFDTGLSNGTMLHYTNIEGTRYRAQGLRLEFTQLWKRMEIAPYFGYRRYRHGIHTDRRPELGAKVGVGLDVINVVVAFERTHTLDGAGNLQQVYAIMPGLELTISPSWFGTAWKLTLGRLGHHG